MAVPDFEAMVSPMDPQPNDVSTTHGFCSVADIKSVFKQVHEVLGDHEEAINTIVGTPDTETESLVATVLLLSEQVADLVRRVEALEP
jgi:hypothetical protein